MLDIHPPAVTWAVSGMPGLKTGGWSKRCPFLMKSDFRTDDAADAAHKLVLKKIYCMWKVFYLPLLANKS